MPFYPAKSIIHLKWNLKLRCRGEMSYNIIYVFSVQYRSEKKCTTHWNYRDRNTILARIRTSGVCTTLWLFRGWNCQPVSARPWRKTDERGTGKIKARWAKQKEVKCDWNMWSQNMANYCDCEHVHIFFFEPEGMNNLKQ